LAGLRQARHEGIIRAEDRVVLLVTGSGLKDVRSALRSLGSTSAAEHVEATLPAIRDLVERLGLALLK
ncbi:MAG TPA: hypothetical protein VKQ72_12315, partial [Aggregatilineales bacterium]|nr:hypothetical protein [Aggregatilineales bacterium]